METIELSIPEINWTILLPLLIVAGTALLVLVTESFLKKDHYTPLAIIALAGLAAAAYSQCSLWQTSTRTLNDTFLSDNLSILFSWIIMGATALTLLFADDYLRAKNINYGEFYPMLLFAASGAMIMVSSTDLIVIFLGLEVLSISLYVLAGLSRKEVRSEEAAIKYFLLGAFASAFFLYGAAFVYGALGNVDLANVQQAWQKAQIQQDALVPGLLLAGAGLMLVGLAFKAALVPFHMWTPDVYQGSPTLVTAFMAAVSKTAAFAVLIRVVGAFIHTQAVWEPVLWLLAALSMTLGNLVAINQRDAKRMLAYSSIAHAGYLMVGLLSTNETGLTGMLFYLIAYSFMTIGTFAVLSLMVRAGDDTSVDALRGLWRKQPFAAGVMAIFLLSMAGIPPLAGFWGKWYLFLAAIESNHLGIAMLLAVNSVIGAYYYLRLTITLYAENPTDKQAKPWEIPFGMVVCLSVCVSGLILLGVMPAPVVEMGRQAAQVMQTWLTAMHP
jgi:NADH-quinone oxidoreductase subunit N